MYKKTATRRTSRSTAELFHCLCEPSSAAAAAVLPRCRCCCCSRYQLVFRMEERWWHSSTPKGGRIDNSSSRNENGRYGPQPTTGGGWAKIPHLVGLALFFPCPSVVSRSVVQSIRLLPLLYSLLLLYALCGALDTFVAVVADSCSLPLVVVLSSIKGILPSFKQRRFVVVAAFGGCDSEGLSSLLRTMCIARRECVPRDAILLLLEVMDAAVKDSKYVLVRCY
jgi:hypothetical protein